MKNYLRTEGTETRDKDLFDERLVLAYSVLRQNFIGNRRWASFHPSPYLNMHACMGTSTHPYLDIHAHMGHGHQTGQLHSAQVF